MKTLYLECKSGISGDMTVAALLDAGADEDKLTKALESLPLDGYRIKISRVIKAGLNACDFAVLLDDEHENHDHDMDYLYGHEHGHEHERESVHDAKPEHAHGSDHERSHISDHEHAHHHAHRGLKEITAIINAADLTDGARALALKIFNILGEAEAKAHGTALDSVHFHEVGAVDSIIDIVAAAVCIDDIAPDEIVVSPLSEGCGTVRCQHGILPVPVPAVVNIAAAHSLRLHITDAHGELVTPTGAAIAAAVKTSDKLPEEFSIISVGLGAGKRQYENPSMVRAMILESGDGLKNDKICKLETNIDDCSGEVLGYVMDKLLASGARDANYCPVFMKKNRPAYQLNVICAEADVNKLEQIIFEETTTIGIRKIALERSELARETKAVHTKYGEAVVKICTLPDGQKRVYPEYESVSALAKKTGRPFMEIFEAAKESQSSL